MSDDHSRAIGTTSWIERAPPTWSRSEWLITSASSRRTPIARSSGTSRRPPASLVSDRRGPVSNSSVWPEVSTTTASPWPTSTARSRAVPAIGRGGRTSASGSRHAQPSARPGSPRGASHNAIAGQREHERGCRRRVRGPCRDRPPGEGFEHAHQCAEHRVGDQPWRVERHHDAGEAQRHHERGDDRNGDRVGERGHERDLLEECERRGNEADGDGPLRGAGVCGSARASARAILPPADRPAGRCRCRAADRPRRTTARTRAQSRPTGRAAARSPAPTARCTKRCRDDRAAIPPQRRRASPACAPPALRRRRAARTRWTATRRPRPRPCAQARARERAPAPRERERQRARERRERRHVQSRDADQVRHAGAVEHQPLRLADRPLVADGQRPPARPRTARRAARRRCEHGCARAHARCGRRSGRRTRRPGVRGRRRPPRPSRECRARAARPRGRSPPGSRSHADA